MGKGSEQMQVGNAEEWICQSHNFPITSNNKPMDDSSSYFEVLEKPTGSYRISQAYEHLSWLTASQKGQVLQKGHSDRER